MAEEITLVLSRERSTNDLLDIGSLHNLQQVKQFSIAHKTSLLVYNKVADSNTKELVRKFRPEFEQVFVASDVKSFISFIETHNNDLEHQEISMVLLEADQISFKILDYLNKRFEDPRTCAFALISSVVLLPPHTDVTEILKSVESVGGANAVINLPSSSADILSTILDVLYRRKLVETTFKDLKEIDRTERYPFLPIFAPKLPEPGEDTGQRADGDRRSLDMSYIVIKDNDNWTECSSMLPRVFKKLRKKEKSKHPGMNNLSPKVNTLSERLQKEITERGKLDYSLMKRMTSPAAISAQQFQGVFNLDADSDGGIEPDVDEKLSDDDSSYVQSSPSDSDDDSLEEEKLVEFDHVNDEPVMKRETIKQLLEPSKRPKWGMTNTNHLEKHHNNPHTVAMMELDMRLFIDKSEPDISHTHTVGGLDKRAAEKCWKVLNSKGFDVAASLDRYI